MLGKTLDPSFAPDPPDPDAPAKGPLAAAGIDVPGSASLRQLLHMSSGHKHWDDHSEREVSRHLKLPADDTTTAIADRLALGSSETRLVGEEGGGTGGSRW